MGSDITRNDSFLEGDNVGVRLDTANANSNVNPLAFKPLELVALVDQKSIENLESLGGVEGLLHGLGTNRRCGLKTTMQVRQFGSPDPPAGNRGISAVTPFGVVLAPMPSFGVAFGTSPPSLELLHEASIEDRQRVYGHNMPPPRQSKRLLFFIWQALYDKVLVSPETFITISLKLIGASAFFVDCCRSISCPWPFLRLQFISPRRGAPRSLG